MFNIICTKCKNKNPKIELKHDSGCYDPDCCGGRHYYGIRIKCICGNIQEIDCEDED